MTVLNRSNKVRRPGGPVLLWGILGIALAVGVIVCVSCCGRMAPVAAPGDVAGRNIAGFEWRGSIESVRSGIAGTYGVEAAIDSDAGGSGGVARFVVATLKFGLSDARGQLLRYYLGFHNNRLFVVHVYQDVAGMGKMEVGPQSVGVQFSSGQGADGREWWRWTDSEIGDEVANWLLKHG